MTYLALFLFVSCSTTPPVKYDYLVRHFNGTYLCDKYEHTSYGAAAIDCERVLDGLKTSRIVNPNEVIQITEE